MTERSSGALLPTRQCRGRQTHETGRPGWRRNVPKPPGTVRDTSAQPKGAKAAHAESREQQQGMPRNTRHRQAGHLGNLVDDPMLKNPACRTYPDPSPRSPSLGMARTSGGSSPASIMRAAVGGLLPSTPTPGGAVNPMQEDHHGNTARAGRLRVRVDVQGDISASTEGIASDGHPAQSIVRKAGIGDFEGSEGHWENRDCGEGVISAWETRAAPARPTVRPLILRSIDCAEEASRRTWVRYTPGSTSRARPRDKPSGGYPSPRLLEGVHHAFAFGQGDNVVLSSVKCPNAERLEGILLGGEQGANAFPPRTPGRRRRSVRDDAGPGPRFRTRPC